MSQPVGGALAFMGLRGADAAAAWLPGLHIVRTGPFRAAFQGGRSAQTTAMSEVATVLAGLRCRAGDPQHLQ